MPGELPHKGATALRKLERKDYARIVNLCLKVAKGDALIKIADGKVSAVHGGDHSDYFGIQSKSQDEAEAIYACKRQGTNSD